MAILRYPDPNRPLVPAWPGSTGDTEEVESGRSFWTRGLRGRDRGPLHQGALLRPGVPLHRVVAFELAMTVRAVLIWTAVWTAVGLGILYGLLGLVSLAN